MKERKDGRPDGRAKNKGTGRKPLPDYKKKVAISTTAYGTIEQIEKAGGADYVRKCARNYVLAMLNR